MNTFSNPKPFHVWLITDEQNGITTRPRSSHVDKRAAMRAAIYAAGFGAQPETIAGYAAAYRGAHGLAVVVEVMP